MSARHASLAGVALLLFAVAAAGDVVHLRDGSQAEGRLTSCDDETCSIDGRRIDRSNILRITLAGSATLPPNVIGAVLTDGTFKAGRLTDLNIGYVSIGDDEYSRREIAEILLVPIAPPPQPPPQQSPRGAPATPPAPEGPAPPVPSPAGGVAGAPQGPTPPSPSPNEPLPRGRLWTGTIIGRKWHNADGIRKTLDVSIDVKLREYTRSILSDPPRKKVAEAVLLNEEGTIIKNTYRMSDGWDNCRGAGESPPIHKPPVVHSSVLYRRSGSGQLPRGLGFDIARPWYYLAIVHPGPDVPMYTITCTNPDGSRTYETTFDPVTAGTTPWESVLRDSEMRYLQDGRMYGSYNIHTGDGIYDFVAASWSVCPEGMDCPPPQPLDPEPVDTAEEPSDDDPCGRSGQQAALADTCRLQLDSMVEALEPLFAEYNRLMAAVNENRQAFDDVQNYCFAYEVAQQVLESIITGGTGPAAEAAQALLHLKELIDKVNDGSIVEEFYPEQVSQVLDIYQKAKSVWTEITSDEITLMQRDLDGCSGQAPTSSFMKAQQFLEDLAASRRVWDTQVAPAINNTRGKGQECANRNHAAWRACMQDAECREETPNCGPEPSLDGGY